MTARITADWPVDEVLRRHPATGPIFLQWGRMLEAGQGQVYPTYPQMTVASEGRAWGGRTMKMRPSPDSRGPPDVLL